MGKFSAGTAVEAMEYDFTDFGGSSGTIPEPTTGQIDGFFRGLGEIYEKYESLLPKNLDPTDPDQAQKAMEAIERIDNEDLNRSVAEVLAGVTSGTPNAEEILALPYRVQQAFTGWLVGELRPEGATPATKH